MWYCSSNRPTALRSLLHFKPIQFTLMQCMQAPAAAAQTRSYLEQTYPPVPSPAQQSPVTVSVSQQSGGQSGGAVSQRILYRYRRSLARRPSPCRRSAEGCCSSADGGDAPRFITGPSTLNLASSAMQRHVCSTMRGDEMIQHSAPPPLPHPLLYTPVS